MSTVAVVGINWGDEGKGRMVDLIAKDFDYVVRYQGGNNAGHTVVNPYGKFILNLFPSGIFNPAVVNVLGNGMVIDLAHLVHEKEELERSGFRIGTEQLAISDRAIICFPFHVLQDKLEEERLAGEKYGSTQRGIAPVYADKYLKKGIQVGELLLGKAHLKRRIDAIIEWKNLTLTGVYGAEPVSADEMLDWALNYGDVIKPYIQDTGVLLSKARSAGSRILFEAQLGALRDIEFGIYPYTSSSSPLAAYAPIGGSVPGVALDEVIGIMKAYSSCVGEGPFVCEMNDAAGDALREAGNEYGAATGRPRRVGGFDVPASRYGVRVQGATQIALTKLDVLSGLPEIPVCVAYRLDGEQVEDFPMPGMLDRCEPVIEFWPGWQEDISECRTFEELPEAARSYADRVESSIGCPIRYISVGPDRDAIILR